MNNYVEYIKSGLGIPPVSKEFRKLAFAPFLLVLLAGLVPGIVLGEYWLYISITMGITSFVIMIVVFILSLHNLTVKKRLILQIIIYSDWILQIFLLETILFTMAYGFNIFLLFIYLPSIITPILLCIRNSKMLKEKSCYGKNNSGGGKIALFSGVFGIVGIIIARTFFENVSQQTIIVLVLLGFTFISTLLSVGLLSVQRLFYLIKLENMDTVKKIDITN